MPELARRGRSSRVPSLLDADYTRITRSLATLHHVGDEMEPSATKRPEVRPTPVRRWPPAGVRRTPERRRGSTTFALEHSRSPAPSEYFGVDRHHHMHVLSGSRMPGLSPRLTHRKLVPMRRQPPKYRSPNSCRRPGPYTRRLPATAAGSERRARHHVSPIHRTAGAISYD